MATATPARPAAHRLAAEVSNPLDRLRGTIRRYVVVEGLLSAAIFLAAWFALGLTLDYGLFKVATWDWVLDAPVWLRAAALGVTVVLLAAIVTLRIVGRLTKELSYPALALVLERRFPKVLGDRLITAVELADIDRQARYGFSPEMIRQTIDEARARVGTVPVNDVFNWRRLRRMALVAAGLVVGVLVAGYVAFAASTGTASLYAFGWRFTHVTGTYLERNVLLKHAPWPRRAHLEFVGYAGDERRIPKDAPETVVRVKAYQWVVADPAAPMGWRPLAWGDVPRFVAGPLPALPEAGFRAVADTPDLAGDPVSWPADQVQTIGLDDPEARAKLMGAIPTAAYEALRDDLDRVFAALKDKADSPSMGRQLRRLDVPEKVTLVYSGQTKSGDITLGALKNQEFSAPVSDLKESVGFVVKAEDFRSGPKTITLVPPPAFKALTRTEYQPAYLHHSPPDGDYSALRGLRQKMAEKPVTLTGDRSPISVPSGTELTLTATLDTDLTAAYLQPKVGILPGARPGSADPVPVAIGADRRTVTIEFKGDYRLAAGRTIKHPYTGPDGKPATADVVTTPTVEFDLVVLQADKVPARRQIMIQVVDDQPPTVELAADVIRKVGTVYYVTPKAKVPFNPESFVRDDRGLSKVAFEFTYWPEDSDLGRAVRAQLLARPFLSAPGALSAAGAVAPLYHAAKFKDLDKGDTRKAGSAAVRRFLELRQDLRAETADRLRAILAADYDEAASAMIKVVDLKNADADFFDVKGLKLLASVTEVQPRYRLDLNVVATDTNYDTGPKTGLGTEPIRLLVVSEGDLLAEINKEEETFATRLDEAIIKLVAARKNWEYVRSTVSVGRATNDLTRVEDARVKAQGVTQDVGKARETLAGLVREYRRIHRECTVNEVTEATRDRFGKFANRMDRVVGENPPLITPDEASQPRPGMTFPEAERRIEVVLTPLNVNQWSEITAVSDAETGLLLIEKEVRAIRAELGELQSKERLKALLTTVIDGREKIRKELEDLRAVFEAKQRQKTPDIGAVGPTFLAKGETKKIRHKLDWLQFPKDEMTVKFTVTDHDKKPVAADVLALPATLKLTFETHQFDFEYDVKAGTKEGEYTITLTPEPGAGDPVAIPVTIK